MSTALDKQLHNAIEELDTKQKKVLLALVKLMPVAESKNSDPWKDKNFVEELEQEFEDYKNGKITGLPFDEVHKRARKAVRKLKAKKAS